MYQQMVGRVEPGLVAVFEREFEEALEESVQGNRTALWVVAPGRRCGDVS